MSYAELFCQSHFSFLSAAASPEQKNIIRVASTSIPLSARLTDERVVIKPHQYELNKQKRA